MEGMSFHLLCCYSYNEYIYTLGRCYARCGKLGDLRNCYTSMSPAGAVRFRHLFAEVRVWRV